jgi:hypothetical protein
MDSACIISTIKYEHDFINQWIEYHLNIGFTHFYLLIDNVLDKQHKYIINDIYIKHVTFFECDKQIFINIFGIEPETIKTHISGYIHELINILIVPNIKEDWTTAIGIDQFIYLNGNTIQTYLHNIIPICDQIIMPWLVCASNFQTHSYDCLMENILNYVCRYGHEGHSNGLIKTNNLHKLNNDSHTFISKSKNQNVYIIDECHVMNNTLNTRFVFDIVLNKINLLDIEQFKIGSFHFFLRNKQELVIKKFFYWNKHNICELIENIKNNSFKIFNDGFRFGSGKNIKLNDKLIFKHLNSINTCETYNYIVEKELKQYDISLERFYDWINNVC